MSTVAVEKDYKKGLDAILEALEECIDPAVEDRLFNDWTDFYENRCGQDYFVPARKPWDGSSAARYRNLLGSSNVTINETLLNYDAMLLRQYRRALEELILPDYGRFMCVRASYGCPILAAALGAEIIYMDDKMNTLPGNHPLSGKDEIKRAIKKGVPSLEDEYSQRVFHTGRQLAEIGKKYPKIGKHVKIIHPDLQGPIDICEVLWGSSIFYDFYDDKELVKEFLQLITDTYIKFMLEWQKIIPPDPKYSYHWGVMHTGQICLRNDSAMNLSPEMYDEFVFPYDYQLFEKFHGGIVHYCGKGDHFVGKLVELPGFCAIQLSQPEWNDMDKIYNDIIGNDKKIIMIDKNEALRASASGIKFNGNLQFFDDSEIT